MDELKDDDCVEPIRQFVRSNPDIKVVEYIRRGCNGEVYFGERKKLNDKVVLKFYWSHPNYDESEEAVILRKINHPNVLPVFDVRFLKPNYAYFLTPKIPGGDLQWQLENRILPSKECLDILNGILLGVTELHSQQKLVHRDLKPGNILFDAGKNIAIVADLGAVKKIPEANGHVTASKSTFLYLPPEAIIEDKFYFQSDLYQIGIILYQLLGGTFHINEPTKWLSKKETKEYDAIKNQDKKNAYLDNAIADKIKKGKLIDTKTLPDYLDDSFGRVINKATNVDYRKRYRNSSEFLKAIHSLINNHPCYTKHDDHLHIVHNNGKKEFKIYAGKKGQLILEKRLNKKDWRKENSHDGDFESILKLARS